MLEKGLLDEQTAEEVRMRLAEGKTLDQALLSLFFVNQADSCLNRRIWYLKTSHHAKWVIFEKCS
jgi:hypothetical protein